ncbi:protein sidekick-2-like, partial [Ylistrum balloti]|uniref:protein sidekick-2-like n=1 Tax=Ylistrum balloti TaxID=509963 RepID=UPI002905F353
MDINTRNKSVAYLKKDLKPYRNYTYQIAAVTVAGTGEYTDEQIVTTLTDIPHPPRNVTVPTKMATSVSVKWTSPDLKTGPTSYTATAIDVRTNRNISSCGTHGFDKTECTIKHLKEYWNYTIFVLSSTVNGSTNSTPVSITTDQSVPGKVTGLSVSAQENVIKPRTVNVTCQPPVKMELNGIITGYILTWGYYTMIKNSSSSCHWFLDVDPEKTYTFTVVARTIKGPGKNASTTLSIPAGAPLLANESATMIKLGSSSDVSDPEKQFRVDFDTKLVCNTKNGIVSAHYVIVSESSQTNTVLIPFRGTKTSYESQVKTRYKHWSNVKDADNITPYVASRSWDPCPK